MNRWGRRLRGGRLAVAAALIWAVLPQAVSAQAAVSDPCGTGSNAVVCENSKAGSPMSDWYSPNSYGDIKGFTTKESVQAGDTVQFKIQSPVTYRVEIYRLGWYGGDGARLMSTTAQAAVTYPANYTNKAASCTTKASTGLVDCGNWPVTVNWTVPSDAVSGLYIANLTQTDGDGLMPYPFVVRKDSSTSDIVVQTSDQTWQAYNDYGGQDLYGGTGPAPDGRAYEVSYNRPLDIGGDNGIYGSEFMMLSWLERNGYDVSYLSGVDVSTRGDTLLKNHDVYLSSGHDEYWTQSQYNNVLAARKAGVRQGYFSGNEVFWKTRLAPSIDGTSTSNRTMTCYKMTKMVQGNGIADPSGEWTGTWMDPTSTQYGMDYQPPNILTGSMFTVNGYRADSITVPGSYGKNRLWRNTSIANLTSSQTATFPAGTLGYEWDSDIVNSTRPAGAIHLSSTTVDIDDGKYRLDWGNMYGNGTATHNLVEFRDQDSGALVFGAGTVQWSWGLTNLPAYDPDDVVVTEDVRMQQATVNVFADMGVQPKNLQSNLTAATASTDTTGPAITVTAPASGATVPALKPVTVKGTATDSGGGVVARTEVSTDGGTTWNAATGLTSWTYSWTPTTPGSASIKVRAVDDSVNIGAVTTIPLTVGPQACPCTIWPATAVPGTLNAGDAGPLELGVKIRTTVAGSITGVRFYKSPANTGTHTGSLWSASGTRLATGTFTNETASGWQQLNFSTPVTVKANTTYVASYFAPNGGYSYDGGYFSNNSAGLAPLTALKSGTDGGNGVYRYSSTSAFPSSASSGSNYWVDVVLDTATASTTPPVVTSTSPTSGATGAAITTPVSAVFDHAIDGDTLTFTVKDPNGNTVPGAKTLPAANKATFTPSTELELHTTYTASVQAEDLWGNAMAAPVTWTFTTSSSPPAVTCPCTLWNSSTVPARTAVTDDPNSLELGTRFQSSASGWVTGVTFYKGATNTGTHTGSLWSTDGTLLASGTFTSESASGWQTMTFATPVAISADTAYVVSYHAPNGNYAVDGGYFASAHKSYPLTATADISTAHNGLYRYGSDVAFPNGSYGSANYWVGPLFTAEDPSASLTSGTTSEETASLLARTADAAHPLVTTLPSATKVGSVKATVTILPGAKAAVARKLHVKAVLNYDRATHKVSVHLSAPLPDGTRFKITVTARDKKHHTVKSRDWTLTSKTVRKKH
ncbi:MULTISPECIES: DUF4082 domain-containing protein [unclassified Streptomyces]|uniref:DUF4082 domain-containing protein n=1 Tax=unclassified Streptomyces TaxID=2593676 RepID=UPI00225A1542|nr:MULTISPECIES: DUF4082 domain-containing protein [unclassified Streptomyces]MCX5329672.1 DUF4082 domain-containing protein [Streptomyces sp. NBC_00140]MCX5359087.1 DUF4082 domain-containing protein [Streptomyces sp. NBC_00124]